MLEMSKSINRDPMAVFILSNTRKAGNTKMGNKKREMRKKEERKRKNTGRTPMLQK